MDPVAPPFASAEIASAFAALPDTAQQGVLELRRMIFEEAARDPRIGPVEECLKWGQLSYHTAETGAGTPIRLGTSKSGGFAIFTHCQTRVIPEFRALFEAEFRFDGNRAVLFDAGVPPNSEATRHLIRSALTYRLRT